MLDVLDSALAWGGREQADRIAGQGSIFDLGDAAGPEAPRHHPVIPREEYDKSELLSLEKETLGLYVSEHPLSAIREQLRRKVDCAQVELERRRDGEVVTVGGIVGAIKQLTTKKGEPMVFMRLDDLTGSTEVVVFNSVYAASRELLVPDRVLVVKGRVDHKQEGETKLIALEVSAFEAMPERAAGRAADRRGQGARGDRARARRARPRLPGRGSGRARARDFRRTEAARLRARVQGAARGRFLRRGEGSARRGRDRLANERV